MERQIKVIAIVGKSGSGKTFVQEVLEENGVLPIKSQTTRKKRGKNDNSHTFHTQASYDSIPAENRLAETVYGGFNYCGLVPEEDGVFSYVIDERGLSMLKENRNVSVVSILIIAPSGERKARCTPERFKRDEDMTYKLCYDDIVINNSTLDELRGKIKLNIEAWKSKLN